MHAGGKATHTHLPISVTHLDSSKQSLMGEGADLIRRKPLNTPHICADGEVAHTHI